MVSLYIPAYMGDPRSQVVYYWGEPERAPHLLRGCAIYYYLSYVKEVPGVQIRHVRRRGADRGYGCRHARRRRPADSHVHGTISLLAIYGFATSMDTTGSSQNRDERLRRRRERERTRRAGETAEQSERRLRQRREWDGLDPLHKRRERDGLDALHKVRRGGRVHCSKFAVPVVRDWHCLRLLRRGRPDCKG